MTPYPHIAVPNILDGDIYEKLRASFPTDEEIATWEVVAGGRHRLSSSTSGFKPFLESNEAWQSFHDYLNSEAFIERGISLFCDGMEQYGFQVDLDDWKFDASYEERNPRELARVKSKGLAKVLRKGKKWLSKHSRPDEPQVSEEAMRSNDLYLHFDISAARNGYNHRIHLDSASRVFAMLIYRFQAESCGINCGGRYN